MKKKKYVKRMSGYITGTTLKLAKRAIEENEMTESEYIKDCIRQDLKKRYNLGDGIKPLQG